MLMSEVFSHFAFGVTLLSVRTRLTWITQCDQSAGYGDSGLTVRSEAAVVVGG